MLFQGKSSDPTNARGDDDGMTALGTTGMVQAKLAGVGGGIIIEVDDVSGVRGAASSPAVMINPGGSDGARDGGKQGSGDGGSIKVWSAAAPSPR
ncbi:hypothetical protein MY11210_008961 [Beauveria gryllotalpidicola]